MFAVLLLGHVGIRGRIVVVISFSLLQRPLGLCCVNLCVLAPSWLISHISLHPTCRLKHSLQVNDVTTPSSWLDVPQCMTLPALSSKK